MKPCKKNRKPIAWLVLNELPAREEAELRAHLEACDGCRAYSKEISQWTERLSNRELETWAPATEAFHRRVVRALRAEPAPGRSAGSFVQPKWRGFRWVALPAFGAILVILVVLASLHPTTAPAPKTGARPVVANPPGASNLDPTVSNYQVFASRSLDKLDDLLTEQARMGLPSSPVYRASTLSLPASAD